MLSPISRLALRLAIFLAALAPVLAAADPPARVGRLSLLEGDVLFRTDRQDAGAPATLNWPISSGAILDTERNGRAEIWIGSSTFRLDGGSRVEFGTVDDQRIAVQVAQGSLAITLRDRDQAEGIDVSTPAGQVRFDGPGRYRIDVDERSGDTQFASREGVAYIYRPGGELSVAGGQRAVAYAAGGWFVAEVRPDAFDAWTDTRDSRSNAPTARRHVSPYMTGYEDLDRHGNWSSTSDYGTVWYPSAVPVDWAPYRYGRWAWVQPWGWTWVDEAPWGFAPFHYGRWVLIAGRWAWVPGAYAARPVYAPALVAWVGDPGWSVGFSFGTAPAVGWFPLAPREVFVPAYRCSPRHVHQVNVTHVTNVTVIDQVVAGRHKPAFTHRHQPQAVTVVPARTVQSGSRIGRDNWRQPDRHELARARVAERAPDAAWLRPAAPAQRPRQERDAANRSGDGQWPRRALSAGEAAGGGPRQFRSQAENRSGPEAAPAGTAPAIQAPPVATTSPAPGRRDGEAPRSSRRPDTPFERPPVQAVPPAADSPNSGAESRFRRFGRDPQAEARPPAPPAAQPQATTPPQPPAAALAQPETPRRPVEADRRLHPQATPDDAPGPRPGHFRREPRQDGRPAGQPPTPPNAVVPAPAETIRDTPRARPEIPRPETPAPQRELRQGGRRDFERPAPDRQPPVPPAQPSAAAPAAAPTVREAPRVRPETPRFETPAPQREFRHGGRPEFERPLPERHAPAAAQPQPPSQPRHVSPPTPAVQTPAPQVAAPRPPPRSDPPPTARQAQSGEGREHRRERGRSSDTPQ